ncbi:hypothetical protein WJX74_001262 [Apatococcus lobatus]|uniref:Lipoate-protein ligase A n=1 Tax=Apatococcus lobatus TaxID=904363 RepID=A0AAW1R037_9CHLO
MVAVRLLRLAGVPILQQLHIEQALLRTDSQNWLVVNDGSSVPAIVMGISGKAEELVHIDKAIEAKVNVIKRFSGGGTVPIFCPYGNFRLACHDYVFDENKFGGNAQAITKQRWLHHTSFLWDFEDKRMALLQHPARVPPYRKGREHLQFLLRLKDLMPLRSAFLRQLETAVARQGFELQEASMEEVAAILNKEHLQTTRIIDL